MIQQIQFVCTCAMFHIVLLMILAFTVYSKTNVIWSLIAIIILKLRAPAYHVHVKSFGNQFLWFRFLIQWYCIVSLMCYYIYIYNYNEETRIHNAYECYIRFINTKHEDHWLEGEVIINLIYTKCLLMSVASPTFLYSLWRR